MLSVVTVEDDAKSGRVETKGQEHFGAVLLKGRAFNYSMVERLSLVKVTMWICRGRGVGPMFQIILHWIVS